MCKTISRRRFKRKCGYVLTQYLSNYSADFYESLNLTRTEQVSGRHEAQILNFDLCIEIFEDNGHNNAQPMEKIA